VLSNKAGSILTESTPQTFAILLLLTVSYVLLISIDISLFRRTGSIFRGVNDGVKYMEMNIHVHKFATLAKQSIHYISSRCGQMFMQIGFVIEGREDTELPETMFACVAVNKP